MSSSNSNITESADQPELQNTRNDTDDAIADYEEAPPAQGVRLVWSDLPPAVQARIETMVDSRVVEASSQPSGFSPGLASRLLLANGARVFVKAISATQNPDAPRFHRREAAIVQALPNGLPVPRLLALYDDADNTPAPQSDTGWIILIFEDVEGHNPANPWRGKELDRVLTALAEMSVRLTPTSVPRTLAADATLSFTHSLCGWQRILQAQGDFPGTLDAWSQRHLQTLVQLETRAGAAVAGDTLLHCDIRADNILLTPQQVWFVDWPHAHIGAAWVDSVCFAPSVTMQGGPQPETVLQRHPAAAQADPDAITAAIVAVAGFFTWHSLHAPPPGLPTLRPFQAAQGAVARRWIAQRTGLT